MGGLGRNAGKPHIEVYDPGMMMDQDNRVAPLTRDLVLMNKS